jgi:hypothetical protein
MAVAAVADKRGRAGIDDGPAPKPAAPVAEPPNTNSAGGASSHSAADPARPVSDFLSNCAVVFPFAAQAPDELTCRRGERLHVLGQVDKSWVLAVNARGEQGIVPVDHLKLDL